MEEAEVVSDIESDEAPQPTIADEAEGIDFDSDLPKRTKKVVVEIIYPVDCGDAMTELFKLLFQRGIKSRIVG
jgi:hypothetical protein